MEPRLLILHLRPARRRARAVAAAEACGLLRGLDPQLQRGGPLSERGGLLWITVAAAAVEEAIGRLPRLGYSDAVDLLEPIVEEGTRRGRTAGREAAVVRWRGRVHRLVRVYEEDPSLARDAAPDRRAFLLETRTGEVRPVVGYRGDGGPLTRRGLPVADARLLVNLVFAPARGVCLDPFAGVGGIAIEASAAGWRVVTVDADPTLRRGLAALGAEHVVGDAARLPFPTGSIDAIATEPPYDRQAGDVVRAALREMARALAAGGRLAMLVASWQRELLVAEAARLELAPFLDSPVDRKGMPVVVLAWERRRPERSDRWQNRSPSSSTSTPYDLSGGWLDGGTHARDRGPGRVLDRTKRPHLLAVGFGLLR